MQFFGLLHSRYRFLNCSVYPVFPFKSADECTLCVCVCMSVRRRLENVLDFSVFSAMPVHPAVEIVRLQ